MKIVRLLLKLVLLVLVLLILFALYVFFRPTGPEPVAPISGAPTNLTSTLARGEYLTRAADCTACHSVPGGQPYAGGVPFKMPFGTIYSTNITADKTHGIGAWSDDEFVRAVRQGISPHGNLYPAMSYTSYTGMSRDDVLAIKAYLFSLPISDQANHPGLGFPFNQRWGIKLWNLFFFKDHRIVVDDSKSADWNRGAYLSTALGHCGECHTERNLAFAMKSGKFLGGEDIQGWHAANITSDKKTGIGDWTDQQLKEYLTLGHASGRSSASGPMAEVVENSLQYLTPSDIDAMVVYLRSVKPVSGKQNSIVNLTPQPALSSTAILPALSSIQANDLGQQIFANECAGCHQWNGKGRQTPYADLVGSRVVNDPQGHSVVQVILKGTKLKVGDQEHAMPSFANTHSDAEIAAVANYVVGQFGDKKGEVTEKLVAKQRGL
ncbi:c-type cytochrome [Aquirhabdus sp.]|uniref:c-type cytochrome n=1 Tax=Aquirhabdus sp. TaxID=2824160 RepID=UPI00396C9F7E